jgi:hypothetical protein
MPYKSSKVSQVQGERVSLRTLLELELKRLIDSLERKCGITLPREVTEVYLDRDHGLLLARGASP